MRTMLQPSESNPELSARGLVIAATISVAFVGGLIAFYMGAFGGSPGAADPRPQGPSSNQPTAAAKAMALEAVRAEPKVKDAEWLDGSPVLWVGVVPDGTSRDGFAEYICEVLRERHASQGVRVRVMDVTSKSPVELGAARCR